MINSQINYGLTPGSIVTPVYEWNAQIQTGMLDILEKDGTIVPGHYTSAGDQIVVLNIFTAEKVALIQYPTPEGYRQGYVENTLLNEVASYRFRNWWQNGGTSQAVLQNDGSPLTILPAYSPATILFINDGYTCIAYGDGNGMPNQSGFSQYGGLFGGISPFTTRDYPANGETTAQSISILDYNEDPLTGRFTTNGDSITILDILKNGELAFIEYPVSGGYRKGFIKNYAQSNFVFNNWDNFTNNTDGSIIIYNTPQLTEALNIIGVGEKATILFKTDSGELCVAYNTSSGLHIGSGYISESDANGSSNPFKVGDEVEILESAVWFATGPEVGDRKNDIFIVKEKINIDINGSNSVAYTIKDCRTNELFNIYPQDIEETNEKPATKPTHSGSGRSSNGLIGGINLINQQSNFGVNGSTSSDYGFNSAEVMLEAGKIYTFTACGCSSKEAISNNQFLITDIYNSDWSILHELQFSEDKPTTNQVTFSVPKTEKFFIQSYSFPNVSDRKDVTVYWYNVQEGPIGTAWVPSLYDLQNILNNKEGI